MDNPPPQAQPSDDSNNSISNSDSSASGPSTSPVIQAPESNTINNAPDDQTPNQAQQELTTPIPQPTKKNKKKLWLFLLLLVVLIIVVILSLYFLNHNKNKSVANVKHDIPLIKYGIAWSPLNTFYPSSSSQLSNLIQLQNQIFEGLVSFQNGTQIKPQLASSWTNPNPTTWIFNLKPNVYYHDGDKVTAQDVIYTWNQVNQNLPTYAGYLTNTIKNVTALNNLTVKITTNQPDVLLLNRLSQLYIVNSKAPKGTPAWGLGTGAYTVKPGSTPSTNSLDLVAFNNWHGGYAYTRAVDYTYVSSPTQAINGLKSGKFNLVDNLGYLNPTSTSSINKTSKIFNTPQLETNNIVLNVNDKSSPASNILIRKALSLAINNNVILNQGQQTGVPADQSVPSSVPGYNPNIQPITQNINEASALVKQAGYPNGVTLDLYSTPNVSALNQAIVNQAKQAGITIDVKAMSNQNQLSNILSSGTWDTFLIYNYTQIIDGSDILSQWQSLIPYTNPAYVADLNAANVAVTPEAHLKALESASLQLSNDYVIVPLYQVSDLNATNKNFVFPLNDYDSDLNVYFANVYQTQ